MKSTLEIPATIFITGTDTGVGKTIVTALLALRLQQRGVDVGVMKPFATGCYEVDGRLVNEDAAWLQEITGVTDELELINPVRFVEPLAPLAAERRVEPPHVAHDGIAQALAAWKVLQARHEVVLVEGVGGLMVPLQEAAGKIITCVEWAQSLAAPVVVVARRTLGTINHTTLTCRVPLQPPAHFAGLVFCDAEPVPTDDVAAQTSPPLIAEMTGLPIFGQVPFLPQLERAALQSVARQYLAWP